MKKILLAGVIVFGFAAQPARADLPVIDIGSITAQAKSLFQDVKGYLVQLQQYQAELQQLQWIASMGENMIHNPNLGTVMPLLNATGLSQNLPINPYALQSLTSGYGGMNSISGLTGKLTGLGGLINGSYNTDHIFTCTDNSFKCQQQQAAATANAAVKGQTMQLYQDLTNHMQNMTALRAQLATSTNELDTTNIQAQILTEQTWISNTSTQMQALKIMADTQHAVNAQQQDEKLSSDIHAVLASAPK